MSNIHDVFKDDDVNGVIIGGEFFTGQLFYCGRPESRRLYGYTTEELRTMLEGRLDEIKNECKAAFDLIYPKKGWEFRFYE